MSLKLSLLEKMYKIHPEEKINYFIDMWEKLKGESNNTGISYHLPPHFKYSSSKYNHLVIIIDDAKQIQEVREYSEVYVKGIPYEGTFFVCQGRKDKKEDRGEMLLFLKPKDYEKRWLLTNTKYVRKHV